MPWTAPILSKPKWKVTRNGISLEFWIADWPKTITPLWKKTRVHMNTTSIMNPSIVGMMSGFLIAGSRKQTKRSLKRTLRRKDLEETKKGRTTSILTTKVWIWHLWRPIKKLPSLRLFTGFRWESTEAKLGTTVLILSTITTLTVFISASFAFLSLLSRKKWKDIVLNVHCSIHLETKFIEMKNSRLLSLKLMDWRILCTVRTWVSYRNYFSITKTWSSIWASSCFTSFVKFKMENTTLLDIFQSPKSRIRIFLALWLFLSIRERDMESFWSLSAMSFQSFKER